MNNYNPNTHHRRSIRLKGYDYSKSGLYFITICSYNKVCVFGKVRGNEMILNDAGKIADLCWSGIPEHFPNVILHEHIIMPNHVHGIIELTDIVVPNDLDIPVDLVIPIVGVENFQPLRSSNQPQQTNPNTNKSTLSNQSQPQQNEFQKIIPHSIGSIIRGFKIGVTKWFRINTNINDVWQRNYYEHIIRDEKSYQRISDYIINNPMNWKCDEFRN